MMSRIIFEIVFFTSANIKDIEDTLKRLANDIPDLAKFAVSVYACEDIERKIQEKLSEIVTVPSAKLEIDKPGNILHYDTEHAEGILVNVKSTSLRALYNKFASKGLFDMNIYAAIFGISLLTTKSKLHSAKPGGISGF